MVLSTHQRNLIHLQFNSGNLNTLPQVHFTHKQMEPVDNLPLQDSPSKRVNGSSLWKEQVNQATPVAEVPISAFQEQESNSSADGYKEASVRAMQD